MDENSNLELMEKNAKRLQAYQQQRLTTMKSAVSHLKKIMRYVTMGDLGYALYALKRAIKVFLTKKDDFDETVAKSTKEISDFERLVIYTVLFGNYDELQQPLCVTPNCDYYVITDQKIDISSVWKKYPIEIFDEQVKNLNNLEKARFFKLHPHLLFPNYRYSMFIDANIQIVTNMRPVFKQLEDNLIAMHCQPGRNCIYQEATEIKAINKAPKIEVNKQVKAYRTERFPKHYGLFRTCVVVRVHNDEKCIKLMNEWWKQINQYSKRDQLSFTYALWKNGLDKTSVSILGYDIRTNPRFIERAHN